MAANPIQIVPLRAEVLDFPHGIPGDIGLFCRW